MQSNEVLSSGSPHAGHSAPATEGNGDASASTASAALETSIVSSTTIASSSLSTFSQIATADRADHGAEEVLDGDDEATMHAPVATSVAPSSPLSHEFPQGSDEVSANAAASMESVQHTTTAPITPVDEAAVSLEQSDAHSEGAALVGGAGNITLLPSASTPPPTADGEAAEEAEEKTEAMAERATRQDTTVSAEEEKETKRAEGSPPGGEEERPSAPPLAAALTPSFMPVSHAADDGARGSSSLSPNDVPSTPQLAIHQDHGHNDDGIDDPDGRRPSSPPSGTDSNHSHTQVAMEATRGDAHVHVSSRTPPDEQTRETAANAAAEARRHHESEHALSTAEVFSGTDGGDGEEDDVDEGQNSVGSTNNIEDTEATATQLLTKVEEARSAAPSTPAGTSRRRRRSHHRLPRQGPPTPATAALAAARESPSRARRSPSPSHRRHLQLDVASSSPITVDALVTAHTLEVASTRSSLPSSPSDVAVNPSVQDTVSSPVPSGKQRQRGDGAPTLAASSPSASSPSSPRTSRRRSKQHERLPKQSSWSTPLFSDNDDASDGESVHASPPQPTRSASSDAAEVDGEEEEVVVGKPFVFSVPRKPSKEAVLTSTEEAQPGPLHSSSAAPPPAASAGAAAAAATTNTAPVNVPPPASPSPLTASVQPLTAALEVAADGAPDTVSAMSAQRTQPAAATPLMPTSATSLPPHVRSPLLPASHHTPLTAPATQLFTESGDRQRTTASLVFSATEEVHHSAPSDQGVSAGLTTPLPDRDAPIAAATAAAPTTTIVAATSSAAPSPPLTSTTPPTPLSSLPAAAAAAAAGAPAFTDGAAAAERHTRVGSAVPPRLIIDDSIETSSMTAANSWTLESARHTGPRLSMSAVPVNSLGGQSPLTMAQFANRGGQRGSDAAAYASSSSASYAYSYSYSYTGSYSEDTVSHGGDAPHAQPAAASGAAHYSTSFPSTQHQRELSVTRVGLADGLHTAADGAFVELTAYEEVGPAATAAGGSAEKTSALRFLRCFGKRPAQEPRMWRTEERVVHCASSTLTPAQPSHKANADANSEEESTATPAAAHQGDGRQATDSGSAADQISATASVAADSGEESPPEGGSVTETARDRDSHQGATEAGNDAEDAGLSAKEESEGRAEADSPPREPQEGTGKATEGVEANVAATSGAADKLPEASHAHATEQIANLYMPPPAQEQESTAADRNTEASAVQDINESSSNAGPVNFTTSVKGDGDGAALLAAVDSKIGEVAVAPRVGTAGPQYAVNTSDGKGIHNTEDRDEVEADERNVDSPHPHSTEDIHVRPSAPTPSSSTDFDHSDADVPRAAAQVVVTGGPYRERDSSTSASTINVVEEAHSADNTAHAEAGSAEADFHGESGLQHSLELVPTPSPSSPPPPPAEKKVELPLEKLRAFYVYEEQLPRLFSWDAEPPASRPEDEAKERAERNGMEQLEDRLEAEALAASEAAQAALQQTLYDMAVHPPRQCLFVEVHGLLPLSRTVLWPRSAQSGATGQAGPAGDAGTSTEPAGVWRGSSDFPRACRVDAGLLNGVETVGDVAEEDAEWTEARLALYTNDRKHLLATGSTFTLPANAAAVRRSHGGSSDDISGARRLLGSGRDSWSDVLVYQLEEDLPYEEEEQWMRSDDGASNSVRRRDVTPRTTDSSARVSSSAFNAAALYIQLEEKRERWVPAAALRDTESFLRASTAAAAASPSLLVSDALSGVVEEEESDADESVAWRTESEAAASAPPSVDPPTGRHRQLLQLAQHAPEFSRGVDGSDEDGSSDTHGAVATEAREAAELRLDEYWSVLAVSLPLPMAELRSYPVDEAPMLFSLNMTVPASPLDMQGGAAHADHTLPCHVRWAVEPPPVLASDPSQQVQKEGATSSWASLSHAIAHYERVCRGHNPARLGGSREDVDASSGEEHNRHGRGSAPPLTVLWDTIQTSAADALRCHDVPDGAQGNVAHLPPQRQGGRWRSGIADAFPSVSPPRAAQPRRPSVCSVVMRCAAAVLLQASSSTSTISTTGEEPRLSSTYCVPTVLSVTGGLDGFVGQTATASTDLKCRTPVMRFSFDFHAVLTHEDAPSLLLTVQSAAAPQLVFGFAEWNPFELVDPLTRSGCDAGGLTDLWLPMFAPDEAAVTPAEAHERRRLAAAHAGSASSMSSRSHRGGMVLTGWLHCDMEMCFLPSLSAAAAQRLWNGARHSLTTLQLAAEEKDSESHGPLPVSANGADAVVDICVVEAAGLRPLTTRFGATLPPAPLFHSLLRNDEDTAEVHACTHVYCEVVAVQRDELQLGHHKERGKGTQTAGAPSTLADRQTTRAGNLAQGQDASVLLRGSVGWEERGVLWSTSGSAQGQDVNAMATVHAALPVTAAVAHTNHPRWEHTFRCGAAALSSLCLRVFDRLGTSRGRPEGVGGQAPATVAGSERLTSTSRSLLLGTAVLSPWMLRRLIASVGEGSASSGSAWLPLLWSATAATATRPTSRISGRVRGGETGRPQQAVSPAVSNGYILVQWHRAASSRPALPLLLQRAGSQETCDVSVTCRCPTRSLITTSHRQGKAKNAAPAVCVSPTRAPCLLRSPTAWWPGLSSRQRPHTLSWMSPELEPWLWVRSVRLQWTWLQHIIALRGGHVRLGITLLAPGGEQQVVDRFLLVPVTQVRRSADANAAQKSNAAAAHRQRSRTGRPRHAVSTGEDERGVFCAVSAASLSLDAFHRTAVSTRPMEASFSLPASRCVSFDLWWYPNTTPFPGEGSTAAAAVACPPRLLGRGAWRFPRSAEADACETASDVSGSEAEDVRDLAPALHIFFTPHEAVVRLSAVHGANVPGRVEAGVLRWQLTSVPRLVCTAWGDVRREGPTGNDEYTQTIPTAHNGPNEAMLQPRQWRWPEVGTPATLQLRVHRLVWFSHADEAAVLAAAGNMRVAVSAEVAHAGAALADHSTSSPVAPHAEEKCWSAPTDLPCADVPRVPYVLSDGGNNSEFFNHNSGEFDNCGPWSDVRSCAPSSRQPSLCPSSLAASVSAREAHPRHAVVDSGGADVCFSAPTVEVRWPPRRFEWFDDDVPTATLWVLTSDGAASAGEGVRTGNSAEDVRGAVRLPRLDALPTKTGVMWLPLFRSYSTPKQEPPSPLLDAEMGTAGLETMQHESGSDGDGAERLTVEHVGFAAVGFTHNFAEATPAALPGEGMELPKKEADTVPSTSTAATRLLLLEMGPLRYRRADPPVSSEPAEEFERRASNAAQSPQQSSWHQNELEVKLDRDIASTSYSFDDFTTPSSASAAPPLVQQLTPHASQLCEDAAATTVEILLGFEGYQATVLVHKAGASLPVITAGMNTAQSEAEHSFLTNMVVFPWLQTASSDGADVRAVRVQTQLRGPTKERVMAASSFDVWYNKGVGDPHGRRSCTQWVPLFIRHSGQRIGRVGGASSGDEESHLEAGCVVGEVLARWRLVEPFSSVPSSLDMGSAAAAAEERETLHQLVGAFCGGPSAACRYAVLDHPTATQQLSLVSEARGSTAVALSGDGGVAGRVREWAASLPTGSSLSRPPLPDSKVHRLLRQTRAISHPCVYLVIDPAALHCSNTNLRAWRDLAKGEERDKGDGGDDNDGIDDHVFRLEVQMEWPAAWSPAWLRMTPPSSPSLLQLRNGVSASDAGAQERTPTLPRHTGAPAVWVDVTEGVFCSEQTSTSQSSSDPAAERERWCAGAAPLCLPLPAAEHIHAVLGVPGLAARFVLSFRLFALRRAPPTAAKELDVTSEGMRKEEEGVTMICVGSGRVPLSYPHTTHHGMTALKASATQGNTLDAATSPMLLSWRAQVAEDLPPAQAVTPFADSRRGIAAAGKIAGDGDTASYSTTSPVLAGLESGGVYDRAALHPPMTSSNRRPPSVMLTRLMVKRVEMSGVDVGLACGSAQRHRQALPPATIAVVVGGPDTDAALKREGATLKTAAGDKKDGDAHWLLSTWGHTARATNDAATTVLFTPSLIAGVKGFAASPQPSSAAVVSLGARGAASTLHHHQQQQRQRYSWSADVCLRAQAHLVLYVRVAEAAMRERRGEELWTSSEIRSGSGESVPSSSSHVEGVKAAVVGKAVYVLDPVAWARDSQLPQQQREGRDGDATSQHANTHEVLLDLESPTDGRWIGRIWLEMSCRAADSLLRHPEDIFLSTRISAEVHSCAGIVVGDVELTRRMEDTYQTLRERVREEYERRGNVPRRLRQHMKGARLMRRQLGRRSASMTATATHVRLVCASRDPNATEMPDWTSQPFKLPSAAALVREETAHRVRGGMTGESQLANGGSRVAVQVPLLRVSQMAAAASLTFDINLVSLESQGNKAACGESSVLATAQVSLPLRTKSVKARASTWTQQLVAPLTLCSGDPAKKVEASAEAAEHPEAARPSITASDPVNTPPTLSITATWSVAAACGDTFLTCLFLKTSGARSAVGAGHRHWVLRWVYCFESSIDSEEEHTVDMPLLMQLSCTQRESQLRMPRRQFADLLLRGDAESDLRCFWSGATTRLPSVGAMGATLRRVELVEATSVVSTVVSDVIVNKATEDVAHLTTRLAAHAWSVEDELQLRAKRRHSLKTGCDAHMWLDLESDVPDGRRAPNYKVLLGLYTSNAVALRETQRLERQVRALDQSVKAVDGAVRESLAPGSNNISSVAAALRVPSSSHPRLLLRPSEAVNLFKASRVAKTKSEGAWPQRQAVVNVHTAPTTDGQTGGVVMRTMLFCCGGAALAAAGMQKIDSVTCRIVHYIESRGAVARVTDTKDAAQRLEKDVSVVLDAGPATSVLQSPAMPNGNAVHSEAASGFDSTHITATWGRVDESASSTSHWLEQPHLNLLRLDIPIGAARGGAVADFSIDENSSPSVVDVQVYLEVVVGDSEASVCYVSHPFSARSVLHATADTDVNRTEHAAVSEHVFWTSHLSLHIAQNPLTARGVDFTGSTAPVMECCEKPVAASVEVQWGLDVLGIQPIRAAVPCMPALADLHSSDAGSRAGAAAASDEDRDESGSEDNDDVALRQLEGCATWKDFLAALRTQQRVCDQQAHLRHWCCRIVGVEVEGLELPMWGRSASHSATPVLTTLLAQLNFSTVRTAERNAKKRESEAQADVAHGTTQWVGTDDVLGVARATARRVTLAESDGGTRSVSDVEEEEALDSIERHSALSHAARASPVFRQRRTTASYSASFSPLAWGIAAHDMLSNTAFTKCRARGEEEDGDDTSVSIAQSPPPGLTLWQLLSPTTSTTASTRAVYALGSAQLSALMREGALFLVQVLARWCSGAYTAEERDAMLTAAAALPTQWMPLTSTSTVLCDEGRYVGSGRQTNGVDGSSTGARVRFFYAFSYNGPPCPEPPALPGAALCSSAVQVPAALADTVYCGQLDHVQLLYCSAASAAGATLTGSGARNKNDDTDEIRSSAATWLSRVMLRVRVVRTVLDDADKSVKEAHTMTQWTTRLAPLPAHVARREERAPALLPPHATVTPPAPVPVPLPVPVPKPVAVSDMKNDTTLACSPPIPTPIASRASGLVSVNQDKSVDRSTIKNDGDDPPFADAAIPAILTTSCFCWQPSSTEAEARRSASSGCCGQNNTGASVVLSLEVEVVFRNSTEGGGSLEERSTYFAKAGKEDGKVVGRCSVHVGSLQRSALQWDSTEDRLDEGWRLTEPLKVRIPVDASFMDKNNVNSSTNTGSRAGTSASAMSKACVSFDLLAFTAPSWGQVTALQAAQRASHERRLRNLSTLQRTEARLVAAVTTSRRRDIGVDSLTCSEKTLRHLSAAFAARPYCVLRVPPAVYRLDTFAVVDVIPQTKDARTAVVDVAQGGESLWSFELSVPEAEAAMAKSSHRNGRVMWLVDAVTGDVRTPAWYLLPLLSDTACLERDESSSNGAHSWSSSLLSSSSRSAGHVLLQEAARLRLTWRSSVDVSAASSLAGLIGGAVVSYKSQDGSVCLWVSGGLKPLRSAVRGAVWNAAHTHVLTGAPTRSLRKAVMASPTPPSRVGAASPTLSLRTRRLPTMSAAATATVPSYQLYASHCLRCHTADAEGGALGQAWKCDVDEACSPASLAYAARLFHTATKLGDRVWLLGGWSTLDNTTVVSVAEGLSTRRSAMDEVSSGGGLVHRRRSEVRLAAGSPPPSSSEVEAAAEKGTIPPPTRACASPALQWCDTVSCVQFMADGAPAPPIHVSTRGERNDSTSDASEASSSPAGSLPSPPRIACHVAAPSGRRHVLLFGGLVPRDGESTGPSFVSATADVQAYDTVTGTWTRFSAPAGDQPWPMARYGHSCAEVPGTGTTQPQSYFVFGGATTDGMRGSVAGSSERNLACALVPPDELLWVWTPAADPDTPLRCTWRRVQMPTDMPSPLTGRFLAQISALAAAEVVAAVRSGLRHSQDEAGVDALDAGRTSLVLCIAGGTASMRKIETEAAAIHADRAGDTSALSVFQRCVEPWLLSPPTVVSAVLLTSICEHPTLRL